MYLAAYMSNNKVYASKGVRCVEFMFGNARADDRTYS